MIAVTPPIIFSKEVAQNRPPHFPARTSSPPEIVSDQISGDGAWMNFRFSCALPPGASRSRWDERHSIRWTLPGRTTYLSRPRRRRLRCRRPRKGGRHAVRCSGLRQTWPPSCARSIFTFPPSRGPHDRVRDRGRRLSLASCVKNIWYCNSQRQRATQHQWLSVRVQRGANSAKCNSSLHRNGARPVQGLLERLTLALGILVPPLPGAGKLGTTSASPSITLAFAAASRLAINSLMISIPRSSCSSVIALTPPECSNFISRGTSIAQTFKYAAGDSRRTRLKTSRPCCCQSSARSSRKRLLNALRVASGDRPGFPMPSQAFARARCQSGVASASRGFLGSHGLGRGRRGGCNLAFLGFFHHDAFRAWSVASIQHAAKIVVGMPRFTDKTLCLGSDCAARGVGDEKDFARQH